MSRSKSPFEAVVVLVALGIPDAHGGQGSPSRILTHTGSDTVAVVLALNGAQRKLRDPECRRLLTDFTDGDGRTLVENLLPFEAEPSEYIAMLIIRDGGGRSGSSLCRNPGVAAVTVPNGRVVLLCGPSFRDQSSGLRENTLIHEMLHTLGLEENPPSSEAINAQVRRRCGT